MVVTTRSRRSASALGHESEELTTAHTASAPTAKPNTADRSAPNQRQASGSMGIPGAFARSPTPQEPEPSSDEQEEDWVSDEVAEAAEERIEDVRGNQDESCHSGESIDEVEGNLTGACHPEVADEPANQLSGTRSPNRAWTPDHSMSRLSGRATGSRTNTPPTPSFVAEAEATTRPGRRSTTPYQTPNRKARVSPVYSTQGSFHGPKYFTNLLSVQYGEVQNDEEKLEGGSDETQRQGSMRKRPKSEAQQRAEDMAYMREIIKNNRRLQQFKSILPEIIPNNKSLLDEISEMMPEAVSGDEFEIYDWGMKDTNLAMSKTPSTRELSIKGGTPLSIIDEEPTYLEKGKWVCDDEHDARMMNKQAKSVKATTPKSKRARPSIGITIDEIRPPKNSPKVVANPDKTNDLRASISALPAGGYFVDRMKARYDTSNRHKAQPPKREETSSDSAESSDSSASETSSEDDRSKHKQEIKRLKRKLQKAKKSKVVVKDPTSYKGDDCLDAFEKWDYETERWIRANKLGNDKAVEYIGSFLDDKASRWYMDFVAPNPEEYTIDLIKIGLFSYCFPADIKAKLRREFKYARQGNQRYIDYMRELKRYQRRLPDITDQQICHKLWDTVQLYIKLKWIEAGLDSESTELQTLCDAAERYERAKEIKNRQSNETSTEPTNVPEETFVPEYTPPIQPNLTTQPTQTEALAANQAHQVMLMGAFPTSQIEETGDYDEDYTTDEHEAH